MKVVIATPTTGGTVATAYAQTLSLAIEAIAAAGGRHRLITIDGADVTLARNLLVHFFLADEDADHILFIDSDMSVERKVFAKLIAREAPFVGCAYAARDIDLTAYRAALDENPSEARARALASPFTVRIAPGTRTVTDGFVEVDGVGFGCVLIRRAVFQALIESGGARPLVSAKMRAAGVAGPMYEFFAPIRLPDGDMLSEDFSFCERVSALGDAPLLAYAGDGVGHVGGFTYGGAYIERLKAGKA